MSGSAYEALAFSLIIPIALTGIFGIVGWIEWLDCRKPEDGIWALVLTVACALAVVGSLECFDGASKAKDAMSEVLPHCVERKSYGGQWSCTEWKFPSP